MFALAHLLQREGLLAADAPGKPGENLPSTLRPRAPISTSELAASWTASTSAATDALPMSSHPICPNCRAERSASPVTRTTCPA